MQRAIALTALLAASATAANQAVVSLTQDERATLEQELSDWMGLFGQEAQTEGLLPNSNSILTEEAAFNDQLQRLLDTKNAVAQASLENPEAEFTHLNKFALMTDAEFKKYVAVSFHRGASLRTVDENLTVDDLEVGVLATSKDWTTESKCVSPVQNQGQCGSCWAFSAVGVSESAHCIKTGQLFKLSEQQVTSCSTNGGSQGCNGGWPWYAIDYASQGLCLSSAWPYTSGSTGQTGSCNKQCTKQKLSIGTNGRVSGESGVVAALNKQPVSVTVEAGNNVWRNYKGGVVSTCPGAQSDHAVIAVGYDGQSFKVKNSWGASWGASGYINLKRGTGGQGTCNVVGAASFPRI
ncbi:Aste57867_19903 [Aphanomyces stellatus]|uniref:Aste57867_19903 protein n=1 Tax=Aphanomyces stellatus TaxID=120398 RepID=A0A485KGR2_9STRA|nr:hypothetical protein As57867_019837 [Aphanomyces stellatus]KAF0712365.1 hypothetical protein As57867_004839 [Aphanomyces stellatus]KAF0712930.1 hypothetical protein As57867_004582 [Aphanomyces stellatus]KAF0712931.1 hypothetical protein As57867_004583 [Aphanomyces stellatus]VFT81700.1 Aste57867_4595 [Aphanomyces stellatus]